MKHALYIIAALFAATSFPACKKEPKTQDITGVDPADTMKINQVQVVASHNSYRLHTDSAVFAFIESVQSLLPADDNPEYLDYTHLPFDQQLGQYGMRGLEIDVYYDPNGGLYYNRQILSLMGKSTASGIAELQQPGFKVLHIKDVDYNTNYYTFVDALQAVKNWSDANPKHFPLFINIETKDDADTPAGENSLLASLGFTHALSYDATAVDALDAEIKSVFGTDLNGVITPDKLRGNFSTLNEMALAKAWPTIGAARGKIFFIIDGDNIHSLYVSGHPSLTGRAAFIYATPGQAEAAFVIENDPVARFDSIKAEVAAGYMVRSRADESTVQARNPADYSDMNASFNSGAHITSTDYYRPDPRSAIDTNTVWSNYCVKFPQGTIVRWNPISGASVNAQLSIKNP